MLLDIKEKKLLDMIQAEKPQPENKIEKIQPEKPQLIAPTIKEIPQEIPVQGIV